MSDPRSRNAGTAVVLAAATFAIAWSVRAPWWAAAVLGAVGGGLVFAIKDRH